MCILQGGYKRENKRIEARNTRNVKREKGHYYVCNTER